jgi:hypothetical protein
MKRQRQPIGSVANSEGYVLLAAAIAALLVTLVGFAMFGVSSAETRAAIYRHNSMEAFYLADAAVERARARFIDDESWRTGWNDVALGDGSYDLAVSDTTAPNGTELIRLLATGTVGNASRSIEAIVTVPHSAFDMAIFVNGDLEADDSVCLTGRAYITGDADFGRRDRNLDCGGSFTEGYQLSPPVLQTAKASYPATSYYTVRGDRIGNKFIGRIYDKNGTDVTARAGDQMRSVTTYQKDKNKFVFEFEDDTLINKYFHETTGVFRRETGDNAVVVNFGELPIYDDNSTPNTTDIILDGSSSSVITATIINTRFTGVTSAQRLLNTYWKGGNTEIKHMTFAPRNGIALAAQSIDRTGSAQVQIGTPSWPGLIYVTGNVLNLNANLNVVGSIIVLKDFETEHTLTVTFNDAFLTRLPTYFLSGFNQGISGTLEFVHWREVAAIQP